jgi:formyl-CoA transferase
LASDERFSSHTARGKNMELLDGIINDWTTTLPVDEQQLRELREKSII